MQQAKKLPMDWSISFDESIEVMRATAHGRLTVESFKAMMAELLAESARRDVYRIICDCRLATVAVNLSEVYYLPDQLRVQGLMSYHMVAVLYHSEEIATHLLTFLDDRCHNTGLNLKVFTDNDLACLWLTGIDWSIITNPTCAAA